MIINCLLMKFGVAAKNILAVGHAVLACFDTAFAISMKPESLGMGNRLPA